MVPVRIPDFADLLIAQGLLTLFKGQLGSSRVLSYPKLKIVEFEQNFKMTMISLAEKYSI